MQWMVQNALQPESVSEIESVLLENRHISEPVAFFEPAHPTSFTPERVGIDPQQLQRAVQRIKHAIAEQELIIVFGDYDADGICSTAILWRTLHALGAKALPFIPHREKHGYGLSERALTDLLAEHQPRLIITVDNGIVAHRPAAFVQQRGIDLIITDHHQPEVVPGKLGEPDYPPAVAIVHTTQLCGATVAWMLAQALTDEAATFLDLAGIATIADQVPLLGPNRSFAKYGLMALQRTQRAGLLALMTAAKVNPATLTTQTVNFTIVPRINAMGRLAHGLDALRLLCTNNATTAATLAGRLHDTNVRRQDLTQSMIEHALTQAESWGDQHVIVVAAAEYHEGVIGLIAGRLTEQFSKPAIAIALGEQTAKASARSLAGVNIVELIRLVRAHLLDVGGHPMAAGFSFESHKLTIVTSELQRLAKQHIEADKLTPRLPVECVVPAKLVSHELVTLTEKFAPFGQANPEPVFAISGLKILDVMTMGAEQRHLKLVLSAKDTYTPIYALAWNKGYLAADLKIGTEINLAGVVEINEWKNKRTLQVKTKDLNLG